MRFKRSTLMGFRSLPTPKIRIKKGLDLEHFIWYNSNDLNVPKTKNP